MSYIGTTKIGGMYLGGTEIAKAYLGSSLVYQKKGVEPVVDYSREYLTLTALGNSVTFSIVANEPDPNISSVSYSTDGGSTWSTMSPEPTATNIATLNSGQSVLLKGKCTNNISTAYIKIDGTGDYSASGNIMSLAFEDDFINKFDITNKYAIFAYLFHQSAHLVDAEHLLLPATTLTGWCYMHMFEGTSITKAPRLPATELSSSCYSSMFANCKNLTTAPDLNAGTLVSNCYSSMFKGCSSLNYIKAMFTTQPRIGYTRNWVNGVAEFGTFVKNSSATWNVTGVNGVPSGWTVETAMPEVHGGGSD